MSTLKVNNVQDLGADAVVTNGVVNASALPAGSILQVVQGVKTDTFTTTSTSYVPVTGFTATITPSSTSSKILVTAQFYLGGTSTSVFRYAILTGGNISAYVGDAAGSRQRVSHANYGFDNTASGENVSLTYLDSPNTTSAVTYGLSIKAQAITGGTIAFNRSGSDTDNADFARLPSSITLLEVAA